MKRLVVSSLLATVVVFSHSAGAQEGPIQIGAAVSMTGSFAREGSFQRDGYQLWEEMVNKAGGIRFGGQRRKVQIIYYDDESKAQSSAKLTEKLITEDKVQFLLAPYSSGITTATAAIGERYKILTIAPTGTADGLFQRGYKYLFGFNPLASRGFEPAMQLADTLSPRPKTIAIIGPDELFPNTLGDGAHNLAKDHGFNVVYSAKFPKGVTDLSSVVTNLKSYNPDIVLDTGYAQTSILLAKTMRQLRVHPRMIVLSGSIGIPDFRVALGETAEGLMGLDYWVPTLTWSGPMFKDSAEYARVFKARFGKEPSFHAATGTNAGIVLQQAIEKAQSLDTEPVRAAMLKLDFQTFYGPVKFTEAGTNPSATLSVSQIQANRPIVIFPVAVAQGKPVYPLP